MAAAGCGIIRVGGGSSGGSSGGDGGRVGREEGASRGESAPADEGRQHALDARYRPLEAVVERPALPGLSSTAATTIGTKVYVVDLDRWLREHPPGSVPYEATLLHEQVHAQRQLAAGTDAWLARYLDDTAFMWAEEQRGWYVHLRHLRSRGLQVNAEAVARNLSRYSNASGPMVDRAAALEWVRAVLDGRWFPPP